MKDLTLAQLYAQQRELFDAGANLDGITYKQLTIAIGQKEDEIIAQLPKYDIAFDQSQCDSDCGAMFELYEDNEIGHLVQISDVRKLILKLMGATK